MEIFLRKFRCETNVSTGDEIETEGREGGYRSRGRSIDDFSRGGPGGTVKRGVRERERAVYTYGEV